MIPVALPLECVNYASDYAASIAVLFMCLLRKESGCSREWSSVTKRCWSPHCHTLACTRKTIEELPAIPANAVGMSNLPGLRLSEGVRPTTGEAVPAGSAPDGLFGYLFP